MMQDEEFYKYIYKQTFDNLCHKYAFIYANKFMDILYTCRNTESLKDASHEKSEEVLNDAYERLFQKIRFFNEVGHRTTAEIERLFQSGNLTPDKLDKLLNDGYDAVK